MSDRTPMPTHLPASGHRRVPWRNGGGVTDEIAVEPHPADPSRFAWRLSVAHVASAGPFSSFPGVDRTLLLVEGSGMELRLGHDGPWQTLDRPFAPIGFRGETPVDCRLIAGPVRDFNVMVDRSFGRAVVSVVDVGGASRVDVPEVAAGGPDAERVVVALRGRCTLGCDADPPGPQAASREPLVLERFDALRCGGAKAIQMALEAGSVAVVVDILPH